MKAIDFVVRNDAGALQRGVVPEAGNTNIALSAGQEISLNLRQVDLSAQQRSGEDLIITLVDGRTITLENYFNDVGPANRLFVSSDGYLNEVAFAETGDGQLFAQFGPTEQWGKWSPSDDLIYLGRTEVANLGSAAADEEVSMLGAAILGGSGLLGLGTAGAIIGGATVIGGGGGGGDSTPAVPTVDDPDTSTDVGGDDGTSHVITVTGTGESGDTVEVTVGTSVVTTIIDDEGLWGVTLEDETFPEDGTYEAVVIVTHPDGTTTTLDGPGFVIDTVGPEVGFSTGTETFGHVVSGTELDGGLTLTGTGEAGATLEITIDGVVRTAVVDEDGTWSATWQAGTLASGEYSSTVTIVASDAFGNTTTVSDTVVIDTVAEVTVNTSSVEGDGIINAAEAADGVTLTGSAQPGSTVSVTFGGLTLAATVDAAGNWSATYPATAILSGEYDATVVATATDAAGNTSTATGTVTVDTLVNALAISSTSGGSDGVINANEASAGLVVTGVAEAGSTVTVQLGSVTTVATVAADGSWTATFGGDQIPPGTYSTQMTATATDLAGNVRSVTQAVAVDTQASILTISGPIEGDDVINAAEASDGVLLSGNADPGALVSVTMGGVTHQAVANSSGVWQAFYSASEITPGTYQAQITATTTDAAGNTATATDTVQVDTHVDNLSVSADIIEGDNVISGAEAQDGVVVTGTTEPGSTVMVTLGSVTVQAIVDANGNWQAPFTPQQVPLGEYVTNVSVTATDLAGNVATVSDTVRVDTLVNQLDIAGNVEGDGVANAAEARDGITLGGQVEAGSTVMVDFNGTVLAAVVDANGNWSLEIPPSAIPSGTYDADITVMATDAVGNTDTISDTLRIDTEAPEGPVIASYTRDGDGVRGISTELSDGELTVSQVNADGSISEVQATQVDIDVLGETNFQFQTNVPDGSHLIVTSEDAAGNTRGTYVVLDDESANSTVDMGNTSLGNYQIDTVDLQFAEEANLVITQAELIALSEDSNTLTIHGGNDDTVTITGAVRTGSTMVDGETYDIYSFGTEGVVVLDDDIVVNTAIG
jgi:hypothetical protein